MTKAVCLSNNSKSGAAATSTSKKAVSTTTAASTANKKTEMTDVTVPGNNVIELVEYWGKTDPETPAFVSVAEGRRKYVLRRSEVLDFARRFAYKLHHHYGIKKGDIVCNSLPNSLERVVCEFGIIFSGATSMNGQIFRTDGEDYISSLQISKCVAVIVDPNVSPGARFVLKDLVPEGTEDSVQCEQLPYLRRLILCTRDGEDPKRDFLSSLRDSHLFTYTATVHASDVVTVMTTSGSTGYSKLVPLTHANICHFCKQVKAIEPLESGDHFINCAPLGWAGGYPQWYLSCGVTRYFVDLHDGPPSDLPSLVWRTIVEERVVYGFLSPMYVNAIVEKESCWRNSTWKPRILCLAGQPIKRRHLDIIGKLCDAVDINYGTTECNLVTTHRITDPSSFRDGCAGFPGYGVQIKIVDDNLKEVPAGVRGEVLLSSPSLCGKYLHSEEASTKSFTADGWFRTDDIGYIDSEGKLSMEGRRSDAIMRGAYILYPGWLEQQLKGAPKVRDVIVVPVPDAVLHHEVCACVVTDSASDHESKLSLKSDIGVASHTRSPFQHEMCRLNNNIESRGSLNDHSDDDEFKHSEKSLGHEPINGTHLQGRHFSSGHSSPTSKVAKLSHASAEDKVDSAHTSDSPMCTIETGLRRHCDEMLHTSKSDPMNMVPKYYVFLENFPLTKTGKVDRKSLEKIAASTLGLS